MKRRHNDGTRAHQRMRGRPRTTIDQVASHVGAVLVQTARVVQGGAATVVACVDMGTGSKQQLHA